MIWSMFSFVELIELMQQRGDKHFIKLLNKVRVSDVDDEIERKLKSRITCRRDLHHPNYVLYVFAENVPVSNPNKSISDQINFLPITIDAINPIPIDFGFSDSHIMAARLRSISQS